ncbi:MAG: hypothetical protein HY455_02345 [Parcubacteria group bacterium]|nr:hypothetical protein [Parcubacteria group bacterium]
MEVVVNKRRANHLLDVLVGRYKEKVFPFNLPAAYVPQELIPPSIRDDALTLGRFLFFVCTYMRGGIESHTAFRQLIRMWEAHPELFIPREAMRMTEDAIVPILREYIGWDADNAGRFWRINAERLERGWGGDPRALIQNLTSYDEVIRRIAYKPSSTKKPLSLDPNDEGFIGFQHKMASLLIYFYDWEGWLKPRFLYPSPADFHHYRLFIANEAVMVTMDEGREIRYHEKVSGVIRDLTLEYLEKTGADPIDLADAIWLYSLLLCGESPATVVNGAPKEILPLFAEGDEGRSGDSAWSAGQLKRLMRTCGACPLQDTCVYAIPSQPYYRRGTLLLWERERPPLILPPHAREPKVAAPDEEVEEAGQKAFSFSAE